MQFLRNDEAATWCQAAPRSLTLHEKLIPSYGGEVTHSLKYDVPLHYETMVNLLHRLLTASTDEGFEGGLAWQLNWWSEKESEKVTLNVIEQVRRGHGETRPLESAPACVFNSKEVYDAIAFLTQPILNTWAAQFVSESAEYVLTSTVSGYLYLIARDSRYLDRVLALTAGWEPWQEIPGMFRKDRP
jgi:hypothetical protein